ncbi:hypothetical protein Taro_054542 [Colocasia esculenta]|uniref:CCHC-type domain-containing protein n=1 Tax=Colocasia esculenta TaxID=4460 RepID=A0A843XQZ5_COLES|nr:hypothetical protein [Colocasia esculenta]
MVKKAQLLEDVTDLTDRIKGRMVKKEQTSGAPSKPTNGKKRPISITDWPSQERKPKVFTPAASNNKPRCKHCDKMGHTAKECWRKEGACLRCGSREHHIPDCPLLKENEKHTMLGHSLKHVKRMKTLVCRDSGGDPEKGFRIRVFACEGDRPSGPDQRQAVWLNRAFASSAQPGKVLCGGFWAISHFGGVLGMFSPRGRRVEQGKRRENLVLHVLRRGREIPLVLIRGVCVWCV